MLYLRSSVLYGDMLFTGLARGTSERVFCGERLERWGAWVSMVSPDEKPAGSGVSGTVQSRTEQSVGWAHR